MTAGKLAAAKPAATTNTTLYRCPINQAASTVLEVCNQSGSAATYRTALRNYDQVLTLDNSNYVFARGNVVTNYGLTISPGIPTQDFDPGDTITLDDNLGSFKISDVNKPTATITYPVKVEPVGSVDIDIATQVGTFSIGDTVTGALTGLTADIYRVGATSFHIKVPQVDSTATSVYLNETSGVAVNDYFSTGGEVMQITNITGYNVTVTRGQIGTTAVDQTPGTQAIVFRETATTTTVNEGTTFDSIDQTLTVASAASLLVGDYLRVDDELMQVQQIAGNDVTVSRGSLSTIPATHADGSTVTVYQTQIVCYFQFFRLDEELDNGGGATVDLNVSAGSGSVFSQGNRYVYDLGNGAYEFPANISVDADRVVRFDVSDASNSGHPLRFSLTQDGTWQGGVEFTTGVTVSGTEGTPSAYVEVDLNIDNIGTNASLFIYCTNHALMSDGGYLNIDLTPNYPDIFIFEPTNTITPGSASFSLNNVNYTITAVTTGSYGYVMESNGATLKVSLGAGSAAFAGTDTFQDSPLTPASDRSVATVNSVSDINDEDYIVYGKTVNANATDRTTGLVVGPGQSLMVYSSAADLSYVAHGFADNTSDFTVVHYIRQRISA